MHGATIHLADETPMATETRPAMQPSPGQAPALPKPCEGGSRLSPNPSRPLETRPAIQPDTFGEVEPASDSLQRRQRALWLTGGVVLELAVIFGLLGGAFGIYKATQMTQALDIVLCLLGSVGGCGLVCYLYFCRD